MSDDAVSFPLHAAAHRGEADTVYLLLSEGTEVNARDAKGRTPLIAATTGGHEILVRQLLKFGADVNAVPIEGRTALREAVLRGHAGIVRLLVAQNADPTLAPPPKETTPEQREATRKAMAELSALVTEVFGKRNAHAKKFGMDVPDGQQRKMPENPNRERFDQSHKRLLLAAIHSGSAETLKILLEADYATKAFPSESETAPLSLLSLAVTFGDSEMVKTMLPYVSAERITKALPEAVMMGKLDAAQLLLEAGADPNDSGEHQTSPLTFAGVRNDKPMTELLLRYGATPEKYSEMMFRDMPEIAALLEKQRGTHWHEAVRQGDFATIRAALDAGADIDARTDKGETALMQAIDSGRVEVARWLLENGANPNVADEYGVSALHQAVRGEKVNHLEAVSLLLERGSNIHAENKWGQTPLFLAALNRKTDAVDLLTHAGAVVSIIEAALLERTDRVYAFLNDGTPVDFANESGTTTLMAAVQRGNLELATYLLNKGANLEIRNRMGHTALMEAVAHQNRDAVSLLLNRGADITVRNEMGLPLTYFHALLGDVETLRILLERGAPTDITGQMKGSVLHSVITYVEFSPGKSWEAVRALIEFTTNPDQESRRYGTTLQQLLKHDAPADLVRLLLAKGASPNGLEDEPKTPLMTAVEKGRQDYVEILLDAGADPNGGTEFESALWLAETEGHTEIAARLRAAGGNDEQRWNRLGIPGERRIRAARPRLKFPRFDPKEAMKSLDISGMIQRTNEERNKKREKEWEY